MCYAVLCCVVLYVLCCVMLYVLCCVCCGGKLDEPKEIKKLRKQRTGVTLSLSPSVSYSPSCGLCKPHRRDRSTKCNSKADPCSRLPHS